MNPSGRASKEVPVQPVERPILCNPYAEPADHWVYDRQTGEAGHGGRRGTGTRRARPAPRSEC